MKSLHARWLSILLLLSLLSGMVLPVWAQDPDEGSPVHEIMARMSTREKIGQLFLVGMQGTDLSANAPIYNLIREYRIGGVVLSRQAENFPSAESILQQTLQLTSGLQQIAAEPAESAPAGYIPLLTGISQDGDGYPYDQILSESALLPSQMALGAAWNTDLAFETGQLKGALLSAIGINLVFGPSLDVMDGWYPESNIVQGTHTFGGSAYWAAQLGSAYIAGMHAGSRDATDASRLLVAPKQFPGLGSADRDAHLEIPTIRKTLEQLRLVELPPFYAVTAGDRDSLVRADGLLMANARYQGFQGNVRDVTTRPLSLDQAALSEILRQEPLASWRAEGGLLITDNLGFSALRAFYDPTGTSFDARQVVRSAFMAGNDLLYTDGLVSSTDTDSTETLIRTLDFFAQMYNEDAAFKERVDLAVERILQAKLRLYPQWAPETVIPAAANLASLPDAQPLVSRVASQAATLLSPDAVELGNLLSRPPSGSERITFLTDTNPAKQCSSCDEISTIPVDALQNAVLRLYSNQTGGQISRNGLESYSFRDLMRIFGSNEEPLPVEESLKITSWIVVLLQREESQRPESKAFEQLLATRPDLIRNKRIVVFATDAPYAMDATEISKVSAYYGLFGKSSPFIEVAARILFQEHIPSGSSPVSIPGIGLDLPARLQPDPGQVIELSLDNLNESAATPAPEAEATAVPSFNVGDTLRLRTSVIHDRNYHRVPDGTMVRFSFNLGNEPGLAQTIETPTRDGIARVSYKIDRGERLEVTAASLQAVNSTHLILDITGGQSAVITVIAPTSMPTEPPTPTQTAVPITPTPEEEEISSPEPVLRLRNWLVAMLIGTLAALLVVWLSSQILPLRWAIRMGLCTLIGAWSAYTWLMLDLPGSSWLLEQFKTTAVTITTLMGALLGAAACRVWHHLDLSRIAGQPNLPTPSNRRKS